MSGFVVAVSRFVIEVSGFVVAVSRFVQPTPGYDGM